LNRKDMLARLKKGEDPLELSIEKWQDIVDGKGRDYGSDNCALCEIYHCSLCPVKRKAIFGCQGTPYPDYENATTTKQRKKFAKLELEFLKSLRPKEKSG